MSWYKINISTNYIFNDIFVTLIEQMNQQKTIESNIRVESLVSKKYPQAAEMMRDKER
jgi:hypothetical protein